MQARVGHTKSRAQPLTRRGCIPRAAKADFPRFSAIVEYLAYDGVVSVSPKEAKGMLDTGDWVLVDVRPMKGKPYAVVGAVEVPIFEVVDMTKFADLPTKSKFKAVAHAVNGVTPIQLNGEFASQVLREADGRGVILMCETGGSFDRVCPKESRSIKAAWKLTTECPGYPTAHLNGGTSAWTQAA